MSSYTTTIIATPGSIALNKLPEVFDGDLAGTTLPSVFKGVEQKLPVVLLKNNWATCRESLVYTLARYISRREILEEMVYSSYVRINIDDGGMTGEIDSYAYVKDLSNPGRSALCGILSHILGGVAYISTDGGNLSLIASMNNSFHPLKASAALLVIRLLPLLNINSRSTLRTLITNILDLAKSGKYLGELVQSTRLNYGERSVDLLSLVAFLEYTAVDHLNSLYLYNSNGPTTFITGNAIPYYHWEFLKKLPKSDVEFFEKEFKDYDVVGLRKYLEEERRGDKV